MATSWREQMHKATYRGVEFGVVSAENEDGRRTVVHEFPQRDEVFVEDMGAATGKFTLQAFVVGQDYMSKRNALEDALKKPGSGTLVHPWYGEITVSQFALYKVGHSAQDGGMCVFTLSFVRDAKPSSPASGVSQQAQALNLSGLAGQLSLENFTSMFKAQGESAHVAEQAQQAVVEVVGAVATALGSPEEEAKNAIEPKNAVDLQTLPDVAQSLLGTLQGVAATVQANGTPAPRVAAGWLAVATPVATSPLAYFVPAGLRYGGTRWRVASNRAAVATFVRHIALVEAARLLATAVPESRAQAATLRRGFTAALDAALQDEAENPETGMAQAALPDAMYTAFVATRAATLAALAQSARSAPDVITHTPVAVLPSLALCYSLSGGVALEADLVARNRAMHPGFMPATGLEVLTYA